MFYFELLRDEEVEMVSNDAIFKYNEEVRNVTVALTNMRIVILDFPKDSEVFRMGREFFPPNSKELVFDAKLEDIVKVVPGEEFDTYELQPGDKFYLADLKVREFIQKLKK